MLVVVRLIGFSQDVGDCRKVRPSRHAVQRDGCEARRHNCKPSSKVILRRYAFDRSRRRSLDAAVGSYTASLWRRYQFYDNDDADNDNGQ